ncbi:MAG: VOC family protein [Rhodospirillales bacterium]|nr:VOC family protein [Rhodospirillales bacterium]
MASTTSCCASPRMDRALKFYCNVLGCVEERRVERIGLVQLRAGRSLIDLIEALRDADDPLAEGARNMDHFALRLLTFDEAALIAHLKAHGVEVGETVERYGAEGTGPSVYIRDPDGNTVELKGPAKG